MSDHGAIGNCKHRSKEPQRLSHYPIIIIPLSGVIISGFQVELDQFRIRRNSQNLSPNMPNMHVVESASGGPKMPGGKARTGVGTDLRRLEAAGAGIQLLRAAAASR